ncbi:glutaredoxin 2 [Ameyamaea chiangmaiensis NBRC 103196]|uniref:Glutaredoxin 2 n=1 Tax=Ameyamaea chiangmaiensis TaxID=442969 RepID=A0A850PEI2_9PROT|nr:glutaredoxin 2 [Ameyamaea chiangmaiensis]MBS4074231.1 glutaredoxin 2 [Ameyamaea chiangmaiensis]NVN41273.1 glutaredoxin 2 [Ameyamaea chiangmaiensis]GBQ71319.1 glutaredoxin 2 [Ameyamaea chiangmaiensis NBRC 103196]
MDRTLFVYRHCPFCIKAWMIFGLKKLPVTVVTLLNDDEATPIGMIGRKVVPILEEDGRFMGESMDIVRHVDALDAPVLTGAVNPAVAAWIAGVSGVLYRQALPRIAMAPLPEFATTGARAYFTRNKESHDLPFGAVLAGDAEALAVLQAALDALEPLIQDPAAVNGDLSTDDIHLFAALHSLSIVAGLTYPATVEAYRRTMARRCGVALMDTLAA